MARGRERTAEAAGLQRPALLVLGVLLLILFIGVAITEGIGDPSIPSGDVALVEEAGDSGKLSQEDFDHAMVLAAAQRGTKEVPKPGDEEFETVRDSAMTSLLESAWIRGQAAEMGIEVSDAVIARELKKVRKESFETRAAFQKFLNESKFTDADVDERIELQLLSTKVQERLSEEAREPSQSEIEGYYDATKATLFTTPASWDIRLIRNEDRGEVERALARLEKSHTPKDWNKVAKGFSEDAATKDQGGLQVGVTGYYLEESIDPSVLDAAEGELVGPLKTSTGYVALEVQSLTPEGFEDLESAESSIRSQLGQRVAQEDFDSFVADFNAKWRSRTFCANGYVVEECSNFVSNGRLETAPPGCYEAEPEGGLPKACPAAVFQLTPALPGTVTPVAPKGTPLAQRPFVPKKAEPE